MISAGRPITELLGDASFAPAAASDILELLAALGQAGTAPPELGTWLERFLWLDEGVAEALDAALGSLSAEAPRRWEAQESWLEGIEAVALARRGVDLVPAGWRDAVAVVLDAHLRRLEAGVRGADRRAALWRHGRRAAARDGAPWSLVPSALADIDVTADGRSRVQSWLAGELGPRDEEQLAALVRDPRSPWHDAYVARLRREASRGAVVVRWRGELCLEAARSLDELDLAQAELLYALPFPHRGRDARVEARRHVDGTVWIHPRAPSDPVLVPWDAAAHEIGDDMTGPLAVTIVVEIPSELDDAEHAVGAAERVASGEGGRHAVAVALAIAHDLAHGALQSGLCAAALAFDTGREDLDAELWAELGLQARISLDRAAAALDSGKLHAALAEADEEGLAACGGAVLLLDDEPYDRIVGGRPVDGEAWWGARERLAELPVTDQELAQAAAGKARIRQPAVADDAWAAAPLDVAQLIGLVATCPPGERAATFDEARAALRAVPCPWLRGDIVRAVEALSDAFAGGPDAWRATDLAEAVTPWPGRVAVLLHRRGVGMVAEIRARHAAARGEGLTMGKPPWLLPLAREGVRAAFAAVSSVTRSKLPPYDFGDHTLELIGGDAEAVEGDSLALPVALAFASLWLARPVPADLAASGRLRSRTGTVLAVGEMWPKAEALGSWARGARVRLLLPSDNVHEVVHEAIVPIGVAALRDALVRAELPLWEAAMESALGDQVEQRRRLHEACLDVEAQELERYAAGGADPWLVLGDRIRLLIHALESAPSATGDLPRARAWGALAFTHGGDSTSAKELLEGQEPTLDMPLGARVLYRVVRVEHLIDGEDWDRCATERDLLADEAAGLAGHERATLLGQCLGTVGRAYLHHHEPEPALRFLDRALEAHAEWQPHEVGRSRIYRAMALRVAGRLQEALEELDRAALDIAGPTRLFSRSYATSCHMYWGYERARVLLEMGRPEEAESTAREALAATRGLGFWPRLGILRTLAWVLRDLGRTREADERVAEAAAIAATAPQPARRLAMRIAAEAAGPPKHDGEVY